MASPVAPSCRGCLRSTHHLALSGTLPPKPGDSGRVCGPAGSTVRWPHMSLGLILLIVVVLMRIGAFPGWPYSRNWDYGPTGRFGLALAVLVVLRVPVGIQRVGKNVRAAPRISDESKAERFPTVRIGPSFGSRRARRIAEFAAQRADAKSALRCGRAASFTAGCKHAAVTRNERLRRRDRAVRARRRLRPDCRAPGIPSRSSFPWSRSRCAASGTRWQARDSQGEYLPARCCRRRDRRP